LLKLLKDLEENKQNLTKELYDNYDKYCEIFSNSKDNILKEVESVYIIELEQLKSTKEKIHLALKQYSEINVEELNVTDLDSLSNKEILSLKIGELNKLETELYKNVENILNNKLQIKFSDIKWKEDIIFQKKEIVLESLLEDKKQTYLKETIIFLGDSKDKIILNYNLIQGKWQRMNVSVGSEYDNLDYSCVINYNNEGLLMSGGCIYSNYRNTASKSTYLIKILSEKEVTFIQFKPLNAERFSHGSCILKGAAYVFGGHNGLQTLNSMEFYDAKENIWKFVSNMNVEREIFSHCVIKDRFLYVFGGFNDTHLDSIERYDAYNDKWKLLQVKLKRPLQNSTSVPLPDDQIAVIGGYNGVMHKNIDILQLNTLTWIGVDYKMKVPRRRSHAFFYNDKVNMLNIYNFNKYL
jgi:hypothetical protein